MDGISKFDGWEFWQATSYLRVYTHTHTRYLILSVDSVGNYIKMLLNILEVFMLNKPKYAHWVTHTKGMNIATCRTKKFHLELQFTWHWKKVGIQPDETPANHLKRN